MESIGIASFYPITEMLQDTSQLHYYRDKLVAWFPALEILDREHFLFYSLLAVAALFVFKNVFLVFWNFSKFQKSPKITNIDQNESIISKKYFQQNNMFEMSRNKSL